MSEDKKALGKIYAENIREFAEMNLALTKQCKTVRVDNINPETLKELRENAQALQSLINIKED